MPLRGRSKITEPSTFFLTTSTINHITFPDYPQSLKLIESILFQTAGDKRIYLMAYVLMPTHLHLIAGSNEGGNGISKFMHSLKGRVRKNLIGNRKLWEDGFDDLILTTEKQFNIKLNYIHFNPVKHKKVMGANEIIRYRFSSFNQYLVKYGDKWINNCFENYPIID
jgi:putative transposase